MAGSHLAILLNIQFIDWPELLLYPWLIKNGFSLYTQLLIPYQPLTLYLLKFWYIMFGFSVSSLRLAHILLTLINDILLGSVVYKLNKSVLITLISLALYILWQPLLEGNGLWFDSFLIIPALLAYFFTYRVISGEKSYKNTFLASFFLGTLFIIKQTSIWLIFLYSAMFIYFKFVVKNHLLAKSIFIITLFSLIPALVQVLFFTLGGKFSEYIYWVYQFGINLRNDPNYIIRPNITGDLPLIIFYLYVACVAFFLLLLLKNVRMLIFSLTWLIFTSFLIYPRWTLTHLQLSLPFLVITFSASLTKLKRQKIFTKKFVICVVLFACLWSLRFNFSFVKKSWGTPPRFFNTDTQKIVNGIKQYKTNNSYFLFGNTEYLYIYIGEVPLIKPYVQLFPWNTQIPGLQERLINEIKSKNIEYIFLAPYHPTQPLYNGKSPSLLMQYLAENYQKEIRSVSLFSVYRIRQK